MNGLEISVVHWLLVMAQLLGLLSAWITRISEGSSRQAVAQRLFLLSLALVGTGALLSIGLGPCYWLSSGVVLSLMVLATTCDFKPSRQAAAWQ